MPPLPPTEPLPLALPTELPVTPSVEQWRGMSAAARARHLDDVVAALQQQEAWMSEGRPHFRAKVSAATTLGDHFDRVGKQIYLACELPVLYPGEPVFSPDLMAVADVPDPGDDDVRTAWVVADEGRGLDLVLEVHYSGDKNKDLVSNVARYARLGIPEYFVYDRRAYKLYGYRLQGARYVSIPSRLGQLSSLVLGLNLGVIDQRLRFFAGDAVIPETREILGRLERLMAERERDLAEADRLRAEAEQQRAEAEQQRAEAERMVQERDQALALEIAARQEAEARAHALASELAALRARLGL